MTNKIERTEVLSDLLCERFQQKTLFFQLLDDGLLSVCFAPFPQEIIQRSIFLTDFLAGVVLEGFCDELAVLAVILYPLSDHPDRNVTHYVFDPPSTWWFWRLRGIRSIPTVTLSRRLIPIIRWSGRVIWSWFMNLNRVAIKFRIGE